MKELTDYPDAHLRIFDRPPPPNPEDVRDIHLIGICGTGMGSLAGLFRQAGYDVRGSDAATYPPMSTRLAEMGIPVIEGFRAENLEPAPNLVIVGNACIPTHPEASRARETGLAQMSLPEALSHFFIRDRRSLVIAGTHGKTTTTGMLVHVLQHAGWDPGFLVGGVMTNGGVSYSVGSGRHFVVEGDEYDSSYFDKRPKFMHYRPTSAVVTSMEFDHADIYEDWDDYRTAFEAFAALVPSDGLLALNGDDPNVAKLADHTSARVSLFGITGRDLTVRASQIEASTHGAAFRLERDDSLLGHLRLPASGRHNVMNALAAATLALDEGVEFDVVSEAFGTFRGMKRRQEVRAEISGITIVDDFAHHPTAVHETLEASRDRWPGRRIVGVFEPRSNSSRRKAFESAYIDAFTGTDVVVISYPPFRHNDRVSDFMDVDTITDSLQRDGVDACSFQTVDEILQHLDAALSEGDVVVIMSNGGFGGLHDRLIDSLRSKESSHAG